MQSAENNIQWLLLSAQYIEQQLYCVLENNIPRHSQVTDKACDAIPKERIGMSLFIACSL